MDERQVEMSKAFASVTFRPASYNKRFCKSMLWIAENKPDLVLTEKQSKLLDEMYHRYRWQIKNHKKLCAVCNG